MHGIFFLTLCQESSGPPASQTKCRLIREDGWEPPFLGAVGPFVRTSASELGRLLVEVRPGHLPAQSSQHPPGGLGMHTLYDQENSLEASREDDRPLCSLWLAR